MRLRGFPLRLVLWAGPLLYKFYVKLVFFTSRKSVESLESLWERQRQGQTVLAAVWHQDAVTGPLIFRNRNFVTMVSMSRDGDIFQQVLSRCGFSTVRGSSSRRGAEALKGMIDLLKCQPASVCAIAIDGPRGPARKVKNGIALLAKHIGAPVFPMRCGAKRRIRAKNWDGTVIPLPFNELVFLCGEPVSVDANAGRDEIEAARAAIENRLNELEKTLEERFGRGREQPEGQSPNPSD